MQIFFYLAYTTEETLNTILSIIQITKMNWKVIKKWSKAKRFRFATFNIIKMLFTSYVCVCHKRLKFDKHSKTLLSFRIQWVISWMKLRTSQNYKNCPQVKCKTYCDEQLERTHLVRYTNKRYGAMHCTAAHVPHVFFSSFWKLCLVTLVNFNRCEIKCTTRMRFHTIYICLYIYFYRFPFPLTLTIRPHDTSSDEI